MTDASVTPQDARQAALIVGFLEYGQAISRFDKLVSMSTEEELDAFNGIVESQDELAIFTNLSRRVQRGPSSLVAKKQDPNDNFERRGLAWLMALARVELGATLAGFTDHKRPFLIVAGNGYGQQEYKELLQDGMRMHYWSLADDSGMQRLRNKRVPDRESLAYVRRLTVAQSFLQAAFEIAATKYSAVQLVELRTWKKNLDELQGTLVGSIRLYLASRVDRSGSDRDLLDRCQIACNRLANRSEN